MGPYLPPGNQLIHPPTHPPTLFLLLSSTQSFSFPPTYLKINGQGQEDCLYLNVFVPEAHAALLPPTYPPPAGKQGKRQLEEEEGLLPPTHPPPADKQQLEEEEEEDLLPVLVYIHGGGLVEGGTKDLPLWDVAGATEEVTGGGPMVVVSIQYRLGLFGFLALEELSEEVGLYPPTHPPTHQPTLGLFGFLGLGGAVVGGK